MPTALAPKIWTPRHHTPRHFAPGRTAMTALIPNGPVEASDPSFYLTRGHDGVAARAKFATETGALPLVPTGQGPRRRIEEGTTNLVTNPIFEIDTAGWSAVNGSVVRITSDAEFGSASGQWTVGSPAATDEIKTDGMISGATAGRAYALTLYVKGSGGSVGKTVRLVMRTFGGGGGDSTIGITEATLTSAWQRIVFVGTLVENDRATVRLGVVRGFTGDPVTTDDLVLVDGAQIEESPYATSLAVGSFGTGYAWSGSAHASTSVRTASLLQLSAAASAALINPTVGGFATWVRFPWAAGDAPDTFGRIWEYGNNGTEELRLLYVQSSDVLNLHREGGGVGASSTSSAASTHSADADQLIVATWDAGNIYVSLNAEDFLSSAQSTIPNLSGLRMTFARASTATTRYTNIILGPMYAVSGRVFTQAEVNAMYLSRYVPMGAIAA